MKTGNATRDLVVVQPRALHEKSGKIDNPVRLGYIGDEDAGRSVEKESREHSLDRLMERYKEPGASNVCDSDWSALGNLMLQRRNYAARRSNHVAEPDRVHLGETAIAQYDEFGYPLRRTHNADWGDGLIRRDEDHLLRPERAGSPGNLMSSHHVGSRSSEWVRFHE